MTQNQNPNLSNNPNPFSRNNQGNQPASPPNPLSRASNHNTPNTPPAPRPSPFGAQNQRSWTIQPASKTVVRFDLRGLGDPFYRLLGHNPNPDYGDSKFVAEVLERGGDQVALLQAQLDQAWSKYNLQGAVLIYNWNADTWKTITIPPAPPAHEEHGDEEIAKPTPISPFSCIRAIDLNVVLNVLARSRSQVLMTRAPLILSQLYLNRSIMTDDPRLVNLARATGYLEEVS
ncbi:MAG: hypothetical protein MUF87_01895 [Anaerolineae bacterium]|jgi:hypothetical protein|nr:hypothetical protein [Anaerolineae bacterium]